MNDFIQQEETKLLNQYGVNSIDKVLDKQKEILSTISDEVLDMAIKIKEAENES